MYKRILKNEEEVLNKADEIITERLEELNRRSRFCIQPSEIAKRYDIGTADLNSFLRDQGIIYKKQGCYHLTKNYKGLGLTEYQYSLKTDSQGHPRLKPKLVWTEAGKQFLDDWINKIVKLRKKFRRD